MNVFDKILILLFLLAIIVWQSSYQAKLFKKNKTISHFWKAVLYSLAVALITLPYVIMWDWLYALKVPLIGLATRLAFFDFILNAIRHKPLFYNGNSTTGSEIDQLENELSEPFGIALKGSYVVIFVLIVIFIK